MAFKVIISNEAKIDLEYSYLYYRENANKKVADNFIREFNNIRKPISENPYFKIWFDDFRAVPMKKYPFIIFFTIDENEDIILIARIFHTSQNPEKYP